MNIKKILAYLSGLLLIGALSWYFFPMILFGIILTSDHFSNQDSAKAEIDTYIQENYEGNLKAHEYMYDGESSNRYLVAITEDLDQGGSYKLYYDLKEETVVFDEYQMEKPTDKPIHQNVVTAKAELNNVGTGIRFYENLSYVLEKELKSSKLEYKTEKTEKIEAVYEQISVELGKLYTEQDTQTK